MYLTEYHASERTSHKTSYCMIPFILKTRKRKPIMTKHINGFLGPEGRMTVLMTMVYFLELFPLRPLPHIQHNHHMGCPASVNI